MVTNVWHHDASVVSLLQNPLMASCARYLFLEKRRGYAFDSVGGYNFFEIFFFKQVLRNYLENLLLKETLWTFLCCLNEKIMLWLLCTGFKLIMAMGLIYFIVAIAEKWPTLHIKAFDARFLLGVLKKLLLFTDCYKK